MTPRDFSQAINIDGCFLIPTCTACPEQYDVYKGKTQIGYLRLRHGWFRADYPDCGGATVYQHDFADEWKGVFDTDEERQEYLRVAVTALMAKAKSEIDS